jgi:predicted nucleotidyltransferase
MQYMHNMNNLSTSETIIKDLLSKIEKDNNIKIIFAVESGSRVWGMDSKDSDYDIRGVYLDMDPIKRNNMVLQSKTKCIDGFTEDRNYDWVLWDLASFLRFIKESNSTAIDWVLSDMSYINSEELCRIRDTFIKSCDINFYLIHHYRLLKSMYEKYVNPKRKMKKFINNKVILDKVSNAKMDLDHIKVSNTSYSNNIINRVITNLQNINSLIKKTYPEDNEEKDTTIKKILYVCRSALSIEYILQKQKFPPLNLNILIDDNLELNFDKNLIKDLIKIKRNSKELDDFMCPEWLTSWYHKLDDTIRKTFYKYGPNKNLTLSDDIYIQYYIDCVNKYSLS